MSAAIDFSAVDFDQSSFIKKACQGFSCFGLKKCLETGMLKAGLHRGFGKFCHDFKSASSYTSGPGIDNLISVTKHNGRGRPKSYFYAADALGSVRQVLDSRVISPLTLNPRTINSPQAILIYPQAKS